MFIILISFFTEKVETVAKMNKFGRTVTMCKAVWHALAIGSQDLDHDLVALPSSISYSTTYIVHTVVICSQRVDDKLNSNSVSDACLAIIDMCAARAQNRH